MSLQVLLVESVPEDAVFFQDVLTEVEADGYWNPWTHIQTIHAGTWREAEALLGNRPIDLILLDLELVDSQGVDTFRRAQSIAPGVPMVLLVDVRDDLLAVRLIRDGAQDFIIKKDVDCAPLAHAIRNAVERHRLLTAARATSLRDSLTGLLNREAFLLLADRDRKLAERLGCRWMLMVAEPGNLGGIGDAYGDQRRDLTLISAADHLRALASPTDLLARIGENLFGLAAFDTDADSVEGVWARIHATANRDGIRFGAAIFDRHRPVSLETLLEQAHSELTPRASAMRR